MATWWLVVFALNIAQRALSRDADPDIRRRVGKLF